MSGGYLQLHVNRSELAEFLAGKSFAGKITSGPVAATIQVPVHLWQISISERDIVTCTPASENPGRHAIEEGNES